jgi:D-Tyr-tRNAtyr deacylase
MLIFHVDSFTCTITEKGRSPLVETPAAPSAQIQNGLLVLASAERGDDQAIDEVARGSAAQVRALAAQLKVEQIMVLPFAHLFAEPAPPQMALQLMDAVVEDLRGTGLEVQRPPFGWFHTWDLRAKGHPLSRVARTVRPAAGVEEPG